MITRLKISGFKNLVDVNIKFGPFTCIAGPNAVGKSNLFDAIRFLSYLSNDTLLNAALSIRAEEGKTADVRDLFHRVGNQYDEKMSFEVEMIIPQAGVDDLGQPAEATITFLRYKIEIGYRSDPILPAALELVTEELEHIKRGEAAKRLRFPHSASAWRNSVLKGRRTAPFISTSENNDRIIVLSQDGKGGRPKSFLARNLPRTVLSTVNAVESPTALLARREMQSWRLLQLEPSALRQPDNFTTPPGLQADGSHLPATLYYLARNFEKTNGQNSGLGASWVYDQVASRLSELIDDVYELTVDRDEKRQILILQIRERDGTTYPGRSLSDGTLRFLALAVLDIDPTAGGVICMEEPENGIHPDRIPAILRLLQDIACNVENPVGPDNPLRQVIVNTHSPVVVSQVPDDSLLVAESKQLLKDGQRVKGVHFSWLPDTWRAEADDIHPVSRGKLLSYLNPVYPTYTLTQEEQQKKSRRVVDRQDLSQMSFIAELKSSD
ncbi:MAG TPA: AAA family ATPase [bacterium]